MLTPSPLNVFQLSDEKGERVAIIVGSDIYTLNKISGEEIAELFNGGDALPIMRQAPKIGPNGSSHD